MIEIIVLDASIFIEQLADENLRKLSSLLLFGRWRPETGHMILHNF